MIKNLKIDGVLIHHVEGYELDTPREFDRLGRPKGPAHATELTADIDVSEKSTPVAFEALTNKDGHLSFHTVTFDEFTAGGRKHVSWKLENAFVIDWELLWGGSPNEQRAIETVVFSAGKVTKTANGKSHSYELADFLPAT